MKKQLTIFAAAAMVATVASVAMAATAPASITMNGKLEYNVAYNVDSKNWDDNADSTLGDAWLKFTVNTSGTPNLGSITYTIDGASHPGGSGTLSAEFYKGTLKLGNVGAEWDKGTVASGSTWGAGAEYVKNFGTANVDVVTNNGGLVAGKLSLPVGKGSVMSAVAMNKDNKGGLLVSGNMPAGMLNVSGKYATEIGETDTDTAMYAKVNAAPKAGLSLTGEVWVVDQGFAPTYSVTADTSWEDGWQNLRWVSENYAGNTWKVVASADLLKVKDAVVAKGSVEHKSFAVATNDYTKFSVSYSPASLTNAWFQLNNSSNEVGAQFDKGIAGVNFQAIAKVKMNTNGSNDNYGFLKASKSFQWLNTWAQIEKGYGADKTVPKVGASAAFYF